MLNCLPGDTAVVIKDLAITMPKGDKVPLVGAGKIVFLDRLSSVGNNAWILKEKIAVRETTPSGRDYFGVIVELPDKFLRPIRDYADTMLDETMSWLPAPKKTLRFKEIAAKLKRSIPPSLKK